MRYDGRFFAPVRINLIANKVSLLQCFVPSLFGRGLGGGFSDDRQPPKPSPRPSPKEREKFIFAASSFSSSFLTIPAIPPASPPSSDRRRHPFPACRSCAAS